MLNTLKSDQFLKFWQEIFYLQEIFKTLNNHYFYNIIKIIKHGSLLKFVKTLSIQGRVKFITLNKRLVSYMITFKHSFKQRKRYIMTKT